MGDTTMREWLKFFTGFERKTKKNPLETKEVLAPNRPPLTAQDAEEIVRNACDIEIDDNGKRKRIKKAKIVTVCGDRLCVFGGRSSGDYFGWATSKDAAWIFAAESILYHARNKPKPVVVDQP